MSSTGTSNPSIQVSRGLIISSYLFVFVSLYVEPIGGAAPKFPETYKPNLVSKTLNSVSLICPAQAHPVASFR